MAHSLSLDPAPRTEQQLRDAEAEFMQCLAKTASPPETNEKDTRKDKAVVYKDPVDRPAPGAPGAPWGVDPNRPGESMPNAVRFSDAYADLYDDTRNGVVDRSLSSAGAAQQVAQRAVAENLAHGASGEFSTHTLQLRPKSKEKLSHSQSLTLSEQLRNVMK
jgi:hypothetical protein